MVASGAAFGLTDLPVVFSLPLNEEASFGLDGTKVQSWWTGMAALWLVLDPSAVLSMMGNVRNNDAEVVQNLFTVVSLCFCRISNDIELGAILV